MKKILMRADDLGYCEAVNLGIYKSIKDGIINNVGLMTNMDYSAHGVSLVENEKVNLGVHVNISAGKPLSEPRRIPSLTNGNQFRTSKDYAASQEDIVLEEAILEAEAQYLKFVELVGRTPDYFDGHAVMSPNFFKALEYVANKYHLKYSPFPLDMSKPVKIGDSLVYLRGGSDGKRTPFECLKEAVENDIGEVQMLVYHPGFVDAYIMKHSSLNINRVYELEMLCDSNVKNYLKNVELITYCDL